MSTSFSVFISSSSDVTAERQRAERVIARLSGELAGLAELRAYRWERQFYTARQSYQDQIPPPSASDVVVCIFWKRLGTPLPPEYQRADGTVPSGTEYEFEDAMTASRATGRPDVLVYRKTAEVMFSAATFAQEQAQYAALEHFWQHWFVSADGHIKAASNPFDTTDVFEAMLETHLRQWLAQRDLDSAGGVTWPIARLGSPFRGLQPFDEQHAAVFFGRRRMVERLRERLTDAAQRGTAFLLILGSSGAGKSSIARAGLLPRLTQPGVVAGVDLWRQAAIRPSEGGPINGLADALFAAAALPELTSGDSDTPAALAALARASPEAAGRAVGRALVRAASAYAAREGRTAARARLLLLIDQLEEVFAYPPDEIATISAWLDTMATLGDVWIIATMRSDFYATLQGETGLEALKEAGAQIDLSPPNAADLAEIINGPARAAGLRYEQRADTGVTLDEELLNAAAEPGSLPLLQFALDELFNQRDPLTNTLTVAAYDGFGGLSGVIERRAEAVFSELPEPARAALPHLLRPLVTLGQDGLISTRAAPLESAQGTGLRRLRDAFVAGRLMVAEAAGPKTLFRLAHDALVARWPRAQAVLAGERDFLRVRARVEAATEQWRQDGDDYLLHSGRPLAEAAELLQTRPEALEPAVIGFIQASLSADRAQRRRLGRRRTAVIGGALALLAVAAVLGMSAWQERRAQRLIHARNDEERAISALAAHDPSTAEILLARAIIDDDRANTRTLLEQARSRAPPVTSAMAAAIGATVRAISPDARLAVRVQDGGVVLIDVRSGRTMRRIGDAAGLTAVSFANDGERLALAWGTHVRIIRIGAAMSGEAEFDSGHKVTALGFGGPILALGTEDRLVCLATFGLHLGEDPPRCLPPGHTDQVWGVSVAQDGSTIVSGSRDGTLRVWDVRTDTAGPAMTGHDDAVLATALSPDGTVIASGSWDDRIILWDRSTGRATRTLVGHLGGVKTIVFGPDGTQLASGSEDGTARIWDLESGLTTQTLHSGGGGVTAVALGPTAMALGDASGFLRAWDLSAVGQRPELSSFAGFGRPVSAAAFTPDGRLLAAASWDLRVQLFDVGGFGGASGSRRLIGTHEDDITALVTSPDGRRIATSSKDGTARIWSIDVAGTGRAEPIRLHPGPDGSRVTVRGVAFSPDGHDLATAGDDGTLRLFDSRTGTLLRQTPLGGPILGLAFSAEGGLITAGQQDGKVTVLGAADLDTRHVMTGHSGAVWQVAFAPAGPRADMVVSASDDGTARLWNAITGTQIGPAMDHPSPLWSVDIDATGQSVATAGQDGAVTFWRLPAAGRSDAPQRSLVLRVCDGPVWSVAFNPADPGQLAIASADRRLRVFRSRVFDALVADPSALAREAAQQTGLDLPPDDQGGGAPPAAAH